MKPEYLECQQCGDLLKTLTVEEIRQVADKPYNFVVYCPSCKKDIEDN